ncbi:MAG: TonB-dependent receptor plug domain-containing protein [Aquabacterium sp.]|nr:TonB-dependent receptor plug domain-containing protein [Aquabacterium sp.]
MRFTLAPFLASLAATALFASLGASAQTPAAEDLDSTEVNYPVVITPTRLRQSLGDVPASVTIITAETLRRYGITRIEEALRLVPGMAVTAST